VDMVSGLGGEVVSSADLIQVCIARWTPAAVASHEVASREVAKIKDEAFELIRQRVRAGAGVSEREVQELILRRFEERGLATADAPVVAANEHSADPHFEVAHQGSSIIKAGDWVLIDLWARQKGTASAAEDENIFSDITWVGFAGSKEKLPARHREVFETVKRARDASVTRVQQGYARGERVQGWQLDDAAREQIIAAGYGEYIRHRTGHSLSSGPMVHGLGVNLDNLETHDTREVIAGVGWTVEPGVYIPGPGGFGVRLEINMFNDVEKGPVVTSCEQGEVVWAF
jgi:Xaa-Pro dipeptidase